MKGLWAKVGSGVLVVLLSVSLIGCGQTTSAPTTPAASQDTKAKVDKFKITVTHYPTSFYGLPYEVGIDKGFFKEVGIEIEGIIPGSGGGTTVRNVLAGKLPFGDVATSAVVESFLAGAPITIVGGSVKTFNDSGYITRKDAPFNKVEDLVGHKWGFTNPGSASQSVSNLIFEAAGVAPGAIQMVATGGINEGKTMLEHGEVDAALTGEPLLTVEKDKYKVLFRIGKYVPKFQQTVIVTSPQLIQQNPDLVKRFLAAYQKSVEWVIQNPDEAGKIFAKYAEIDAKVSVEVVKELAKLNHWGVDMDIDGINNVLKGMQYVGTFKKGTKIPWEELVNQSQLPQDKRIDTKKLLGN